MQQFLSLLLQSRYVSQHQIISTFSHKLYYSQSWLLKPRTSFFFMSYRRKQLCPKLYTIWAAQDIGSSKFGSQNIGSRTIHPQEGICTHILHSDCTLITILWVIKKKIFFNSYLFNAIRFYNWHLSFALGLAFCD